MTRSTARRTSDADRTMDHAPAQRATWCLVGTPNVGKSSLINAVAGSRLQVGNWSGTTVEVTSARARMGSLDVTLVDLPGAYALAGTSSEELLVLPALRSNPDALVIDVVDANHLARDLSLTLELSELGRPIVVVVNLIEQAGAKGIAIDADALSRALGVPVVALLDHRRHGAHAVVDAARTARVATYTVSYPAPVEAAVQRLREVAPDRWTALAWLSDEAPVPPAVASRVAAERQTLDEAGVDPFLAVAEARHVAAHAVSREALSIDGGRRDPAEAVDRWVLHPVAGPCALIVGLALTFHLTFALSDPWVGFLGLVQEVMAGWVAALTLPPLLASFLAGALIEGVGTVLAFVPVLFVLYVLLGILENAGILARVAFLADGLMRAVGLPGRAVLPMVLAIGCTVPAIQATRSLESRGDRLRVALALPSIPCGARLPVFVLLAAAFVPAFAALVVTTLYVLGFGVAVLSALLFRRLLREPAGVGAMELPSYRWPPLRLVMRLAWARTRSFLKSAGGPILVAVVAVWALLEVQLPSGVGLFEALAQSLVPLFAPLGFGDWRIVGALIPATVAKEVAIGSLALTLVGAEAATPIGVLEGLGALAIGFFEALHGTVVGLWGSAGPAAIDAMLGERVAGVLSTGGAVALMVFMLLYVPCVATLAALRRSFGTRWMLLSVAYQFGVAYLAAWAVLALWP